MATLIENARQDVLIIIIVAVIIFIAVLLAGFLTPANNS